MALGSRCRKLSGLLCGLLTVLLPVPQALAHSFFSASLSALEEATVKGRDAQLRQQSYTLAAGYEFVGLRYKHNDYDFASGHRYMTRSDRLVIDLRHTGSLKEDWGYFAALGYGLGFEEDVHLGDNYSILAALGLEMPLTAAVTGYLGAAANFNQAENKYTPIVGVKFGDPADRGWSGGIAYPYTRAAYRFDEAWAVDFNFSSIKEVTQLRDESPLAKRGYVIEESSSAGIQLNLTPAAGLHLYVGLKYHFSREYELFDSDAHSLGEYELDPAWGGYGGIDYRF